MKRRKILKNSLFVMLLVITIVGLILGLAILFIKIDEKNKRTEAEKRIQELQDTCYGNKYIGELSLEGMNKEQIISILDNEISQIKNRVVKVEIDAQEYVNTIDTFKPKIEIIINGETSELSNDEIAEYLIRTDKDLSELEQLRIIEHPDIGTKIEIKFDYSIDGKIIEEYVADLAGRFYVEEVGATMTLLDTGGFQVTDSRDEKKLKQKKLKNALKSTSSTNDWKSVLHIKGEVKTSPAHFDSEKLKEINTLISSYQTNFVAASSRGNNIIVGTSRINGTVLMPGDTFSVDETILPRTYANGYSISKAYLNGRTVDSVGGGVCQISTTLYNTVLRTGIIPEARQPHSKPVSYVPLGLDAAISEGSKDLVFTNTLSAPIYIEAINRGNTLIYNFYSTENALEDYTYEPRSIIRSSRSATTYLDVYKDGELVESIYLHDDRYR